MSHLQVDQFLLCLAKKKVAKTLNKLCLATFYIYIYIYIIQRTLQTTLQANAANTIL